MAVKCRGMRLPLAYWSWGFSNFENKYGSWNSKSTSSYKSGVLGTGLATAAKFVVSLDSASQFLLPVLTWMSLGWKDPDLLTDNEKLCETIVKLNLENYQGFYTTKKLRTYQILVLPVCALWCAHMQWRNFFAQFQQIEDMQNRNPTEMKDWHERSISLVINWRLLFFLTSDWVQHL